MEHDSDMHADKDDIPTPQAFHKPIDTSVFDVKTMSGVSATWKLNSVVFL